MPDLYPTKCFHTFLVINNIFTALMESRSEVDQDFCLLNPSWTLMENKKDWNSQTELEGVKLVGVKKQGRNNSNYYGTFAYFLKQKHFENKETSS